MRRNAPPVWLCGLALLALLLCGGCDQADSCRTAHNGSCEELAGCALGTDSSDCDHACERPWTEKVVAACAHDLASAPPSEIEADRGSAGYGGPVGTWDGTVPARSASSASTEVDRHFRVHVPRGYDPEVPAPVLFVMGGFLVDLYYLPTYTELERSAELADVILVYLQPEWRNFGGSLGWVFAWYVYENAWSGGWEDNPDIDFLARVRDEVGGLYNIDRTRTFVSGHSRGAALSVIATFERPDLFAGFCAQAGFVTVNDYDDRMRDLAPESPRAGVIVHGIDDPDVGVGNSDILAEDLLELGWDEGEHFDYMRLPQVTHFWQPQYNQEVLDFLIQRPMPLAEAAP